MKIASIIPVFNEQKTVGKVVRTVIDSGLFSEVICIDDGSNDHTYDILKKFGSRIRRIHLSKNRGKGYALAKGVESARSGVIMLLDADLVGLTKAHLKAMINGLKGHRGVVGNPTERSYPAWHPVWLRRALMGTYHDIFSGERVYYRRDLLKLVPKLRTAGNADVVLFNRAIRDAKVVNLYGVYCTTKQEKVGMTEAVRSYFKEFFEIARHMGEK